MKLVGEFKGSLGKVRCTIFIFPAKLYIRKRKKHKRLLALQLSPTLLQQFTDV